MSTASSTAAPVRGHLAPEVEERLGGAPSTAEEILDAHGRPEAFLVAGERVVLPVEVRSAAMVSATFLVDGDAAQAMVDHTGLTTHPPQPAQRGGAVAVQLGEFGQAPCFVRAVKSGTVGPPADLYAVGHLAFTMLVGQPYWLEDALAFETVYPLLLKIMQGASEPASERAKRNKQVTLPPAFDPWFAKATAHSPDDRYKSATASIFALADALDVARPMLLSWPIDPAVATATTISPPKNDRPSDADHRESTAIPLLPRPAGTPRTGPVAPEPLASF